MNIPLIVIILGSQKYLKSSNDKVMHIDEKIEPDITLIREGNAI